jgi:hypothetical protein
VERETLKNRVKEAISLVVGAMDVHEFFLGTESAVGL